MADNIIEYLKENHAKGHSFDELAKQLIKSGHKKTEVIRAIESLTTGNELLENKLGDLAEKSVKTSSIAEGVVQGDVGSLLVGTTVGATAAAKGAQLAASLLKTEDEKATITTKKSQIEIIKLIQAYVEREGSYQDTTEKQGLQVITGTVGGGLGGLNPVFVTFVLEPIEKGQTKIHIGTKAKEGLIKQNSAKKALKKIAAYLNS